MWWWFCSFTFQKSNFKVGESARFLGGTGRKIGLKVEQWSFSQNLSREFSRLSLAHKNTLFCTFSDQIPSPQSSKSTKKVKKLYFWTNFKQFPHFLPSLYFGAKFQILLCLPHYRSCVGENFVFKTYAYPTLSRKNVRGSTRPPCLV